MYIFFFYFVYISYFLTCAVERSLHIYIQFTYITHRTKYLSAIDYYTVFIKYSNFTLLFKPLMTYKNIC